MTMLTEQAEVFRRACSWVPRSQLAEMLDAEPDAVFLRLWCITASDYRDALRAELDNDTVAVVDPCGRDCSTCDCRGAR